MNHDINTPNCLNFYKKRKLPLPAPHFAYTTIKQKAYNFNNTYDKWITVNFNGRYYIGGTYDLKEDGSTENYIKIGFEDPAELTLFILGCPYLKY